MKCKKCGYSEKKDFRRSDPQNRYLHGIIFPMLSDHTGFSESDMKSVTKWIFGVRSTSNLTTSEFIKFTDLIRNDVAKPDGLINSRFGTESLYIPEPNEDLGKDEPGGELLKLEGVIPMASASPGEKLTVQNIKGDL
jgi:hypothetical protein